MNNNTAYEAAFLLEEVRRQKPLIHHITNYVTVNDCANIVLSIGASPVMADELGEVEDIVSISSALVLNIGTLNTRTLDSMIAAGKKANALGIPIVLDPVGAGASKLRNEVTERILAEVKISVLRGNMSEIRFVSGLSAATKGVDASEEDIQNGDVQSRDIAINLSKKLSCVVVITGAVDTVSDGEHTVFIENGHKMLSNVTGTGCMSTSLIGAFCAVTDNALLAAVSGMVCMGLAGEIAFENAGQNGSGSFHIAILDAISNLNRDTILRRARIHAA